MFRRDVLKLAASLPLGLVWKRELRVGDTVRIISHIDKNLIGRQCEIEFIHNIERVRRGIIPPFVSVINTDTDSSFYTHINISDIQSI